MIEVLRQQLVPSRKPKGKIILAVVGEGPGKEEDMVGEPWVGAAGQLLKEIFSDAGIDWKRV